MAKFKKSNSKARIGLSLLFVVLIAGGLFALGIYALPTLGGEVGEDAPTISGIEYSNLSISKDADLSQVLVTIRYSDGTSKQIAMSELIVQNLDVTQTGSQNVVLNYGGYAQMIAFNVVDTNCVITYKATPGGYINGQATQTIPAGQDGSTVTAVAEVGYEFVEWNDRKKENVRKETQVSQSMELIANFRRVQHLVIFHYYDGTTAREELVNHGDRPSRIPNPESNLMKVYGHRFIGWDQSYTSVTAPLEIHPIYEKVATDIDLTITQDLRNNTPLGNSDLRYEGYYEWGSYANLIVTPREQRLFTGWSIRTHSGWYELGTTAQQNIQIYLNGNYIQFTSTLVSSATSEYRLQFMPEEGMNVLEIKANFAYQQSLISYINYSNPYGTPFILPYGEPIGSHRILEPTSSAGDVFLGWYDSSVPWVNGAPAYYIDHNTRFTQDAVLRAHYRPKILTVTYNGVLADNKSEIDKTFEVPYQGRIPDYEIPAVVPEREFYNFIGWYLYENGLLTSFVVDGEFTVFSNIEVRPRFEVITYKLDIGTSGAGAAYNNVNGNLQLLPTGSVTVDAITEYTLTFQAAEGYSIYNFSSTFGGTIQQMGDPVTRVDYLFRPTENMSIAIEYGVSYYDLVIHNGNATYGGSVTYQNDQGDGLIINNDNEINLIYAHGTTKTFFFEAEPSTYIQSIFINGTEIANIPRNALTYSLPIEAIDEHTEIIVNYDLLTYVVAVPFNTVNYSVVPQDEQDSYPLGSSPLFDVASAQGYYISAIRINGTAVNLYNSTANFTITNLKVNNQTVIGSQDVRVTSFTIRINNLTEDKALTIEYAPLFYNVNVSRIGLGSIIMENISMIGYNQNFSVVANTSIGYFVRSVVVNGVEKTYPERETQQIENFTNIKQDMTIVFNFNIVSHKVFFNGAGSNPYASATVYKFGEAAKPFVADYTENAGSNLSYIIVPNEGYYIHSLVVDGQDFAVDPTSNTQLVEINDISKNILVVADIRKISYEIEVNINNTNYGSVITQSGDFIVEYNGQETITFIPNAGYRISSVIYNSVNVTSNLIDGNKLVLNNVKGASQISVVFERIIFNINIVSNTNGNIVLSNTTVNLGNDLTVSITADNGYVITGYLINDISYTVDNLAYISFNVTNITQTQNISVNYALGEETASKLINVNVVGNGFIYGNIVQDNGDGSYTIATSDDLYLALFAHTGNFIESINGTPLGNVRSLAYYVENILDGEIINIVFSSTLYDIVINSEINGSVSSSISEGYHGDTVEYTLVPDEGYVLEYLKINGFVVATSGLTYTTTLSATHEVEAKFTLRTYNIINNSASNGALTTLRPYYYHGDTVVITVIPNVGFYLSSLIIGTGEGSVALNQAQLDTINAASRLDKKFVVPSELATTLGITENGLVLSATFTGNQYNINIVIANTGSGSVPNRPQLTNLTATHGQAFPIVMQAAPNNFIDQVFVNGQPIDLMSLVTNATINPATNELIYGIYTIDVRQDNFIEIVFKEDEFKVSVVDSFNGKTTVGDNLSEVIVNTGENVRLTMRANEGYHIASVLINGVFVNNSQIFPSDNPNHNSSNFYYILNVHENMSIRVIYEINTYTAAINTINNSPNFKEIDAISNQYGVVDIYGYPSMDHPSGNETTLFYNIPHGSNLSIMINPIRSKGYYISSFKITWKPNESFPGFQEIIPLDMNPNGYVYIFENITNDILEIEIVFARELFNLSEVVASEVGSISTQFSNPITGSTVHISSYVNGDIRTYTDIEYGIQFITNVTAPYGYSRDTFTVNDFSRLSYIRNNRYTSYVQSHMDIEVNYVINYYNVSIEDITYSFSNLRGTVEIYHDGILVENNITVMHGTELTFVVIPYYLTKGYQIYEFNDSGTLIDIFNRNAVFEYVKSIESDTNISVAFSINTYSIVVNQPNQGGRVTSNGVSTNFPNIEWGKNLTLHFEINQGYRINQLWINGVAQPFDDIVNGSTFVVSNIKEIQNITVVYVRESYTIAFEGNFDDTNTHIDGGVRVDPYAVFNGNVVDVALFSDTVYLHFKPAVGYELGAWSIYVNGVLQLIDYSMLTSDPNNRDWKIYCVESLSGNMVVNATYQIKTYNLSANLNNNNIGSFTLSKDGAPLSGNTVEHFDAITIILNADYGYSLQYLIVNYQYYFVGDLLGYCDVTYINNDNTYTYTITLLVVDTLIKNIFGNLVIEMALMQNFYRIVVNPVDAEGNPSDKLMPTGTLDNFHGDQIFIPQSLSEGYSITGLKINGLDPLVNNNYGLDVYSAVNYNASSLSLQLIGGLVRYIDMHGTAFGSNDTLVFEYLITIDLHTITIKQHTIETNVNPELQNNVPGITTTNLIIPDNPNEVTFRTSEQTIATTEYFARASVTSTLHQGLPYRFDGYQELIDGVWTKVVNGQNGITITGNNITYIIKADRVFRAVYYRQYNIIIDVAPEHKYVSGSYSLGNNTLNIREYASIQAEINVIGAPNVPLQDLNPSNKFRYEYIVDCTRTILLSFNDSVAQNYSSEVKYQVVTYDGDIMQFSAPLNRPGIDGVPIVGDMYIYASFNNNIQFNIVRETIGSEHPSGTGNVPTYFLKPNGSTAYNQHPINLAQTPVKALDTVKIIVPTVANYRFDGIYRLMVDTQSTLNQGRVIFYPNTWAKVTPTDDGHVTVTTEGTNTIYEIRVTDNSVYKITYYKTFDVTFSVDYKEVNGSVQPTVTNAVNSLAETDSHMYNPQLNRYDYGASFISVLNKDMTAPMLQTLNSNYQFIGWYVKYANEDRINRYRYIFDYYEDQYDLNVTLEQYHAFNNPDGLQLDGIIKIEFIAVFVPVYEVTILNEYIYTSQEGTTFHFNGGDVTLTSQLYNGTFYNDSDTTVLCTNGFDNMQTRYIMGSRMDPDNYDVWIDNYIYLDVILNQTFEFVEWQIFNFDLGQWVTFNYFGNEQNPTSANYAPLLNRNMYIRPVYQKTVTINLNTTVFYYNHGSPTNDQIFINEQNPLAEQVTGSEIKSGKTITVNFDTVVTLFHGAGENLNDPTDNAGYEFLGWFREGISYSEEIPCYAGLGASTTIRVDEWFIDQDNFGNPYNKSLDEYQIEGRYIKLWQITARSYNEIGGILGDNAPRLTFDGEETYRAGLFDSVTRIMRAGTTLPIWVDYNNQTNYSNFSITNDKLQRVVNSVHNDLFVYDNPSDPNYLTGYLYAQGNRTVEIVYRTFATLTITGVLEGGTILFEGHSGNSWNLHQAIGALSVTDGDTDYDHSGEAGQIKIINLDVFNKNNGTSAYRGTYGTVLRGMNPSNFESLYTTANQVIDFYQGNQPQKNLVVSYGLISGGVRPFESGQGISSNPYKITTQDHLYNLGKYYNIVSLSGIYFEILNNIGLSIWNSPLCSTGNGFDGNLNGGGNSLTNLRFTESTNYHGLFARLSNATIENLIITGGVLNGGGNNYIGYLAGYINSSTITNVTLQGGTVSGGAYVGAFSGESLNTVFDNCTLNNVKVGSNGNFIGGFAGILGGNASRILNSKMLSSEVTSSGTEVGGFVGRLNNSAQVNNNTLEGTNIIGSNNSYNVGGFVGRINSTSAVFGYNEIKGNVTINGLYHSHDAWYNYGAGGMVGRNQGIVVGNKITSGTITIKASVGGGIVGVNYGTMGELNAAGNGSVTESDNVLSGGLIDFDLRNQRSVLGGHVGGNYGGTITGSRNTKNRGSTAQDNWTISEAMVAFRQFNIAIAHSTADMSGVEYDWKHTYLGGIAGYSTNGSTIRYSENQSKLIHARKLGDYINTSVRLTGGNAQNVHMFLGGIVGESAGNVLNCVSNGAVLKSLNFLDADQGAGSEWGSGGDRRREYNRLGGIVGSQVGGAVNNCSASNTTIYLRGIKYSTYRWGTLGVYTYNQSDLTVSGRTGVGFADGGTRSGNSAGTGNSVSANHTNVGSRTDGAFNFTNDTSTNFN